jgi:hypothetical protein
VVAVEVWPTTLVANNAQWAKVKIEQHERVGDGKKSWSFITGDSSAESVRHKKLESKIEFLVGWPVGQNRATNSK